MISFCFAGFDRHLPGFDRYSVLGDDSDGSFNLKVVSAVKDDEAKYECQVGPGKGNPPIRASAFLTVNCTCFVRGFVLTWSMNIFIFQCHQNT